MPVRDNLEKIEERIEKACIRSGRKRDEITLVGVTKFLPIETVEEGYKAGIRQFGESRVQEAVLKYKTSKGSQVSSGIASPSEAGSFKEKYPDTTLHFIGPLQRNKVKHAVSLFDCVQSVDREDLVPELGKCTSAFCGAGNSGRGGPLQVLLEFRTGEDSKCGFTALDDLYRTVELALDYPLLGIGGLMTIAPDTVEENILRKAFRHMVKIQRELKVRFPAVSWSCLSMGMSNDFETAVEEGSTMLRIGSAIFGERN